MKYVYFGSFHLSAEILGYLMEAGMAPALVVCSPDRPAGRKHILTPPAVKQLILEKKWPIKILQPEKPNEIIQELKAIHADFFLVMGYPHIIGADILSIPRLGTIGVHPSLLPKYRGPSPIQTALLNGDAETGVTLYLMDEKTDHGPIIKNCGIDIEPEDTNERLSHTIAKVASGLLTLDLENFVSGSIKTRAQDHSQATITRKFTSADGEVDMAKDNPKIIYNKIRAFNPEPSVWTTNFPNHVGKRVKLLEAQWRDEKLVITKIQLEGKTPISI